MNNQSKVVREIPLELLERTLKADPIGADSVSISQGWDALRELRGLLAKPVAAHQPPALTEAEVNDIEWAIEAAADYLGGLVDIDEKSEHRRNVEQAKQALNKARQLNEDPLKAEIERLTLEIEIMAEAARNVLRFSEPTCLNDVKYRDRLAEMSKELRP